MTGAPLRRPFGALVACAALVAGAAGAGAEPPVHREARPMMGTLATVELWAPDAATGEAAADAVFACWVAVDSLVSSWNGNSVIGRLNRAPAGTWQDVGPEAAGLLEVARQVARRTGGAFDPTILPLVRLWGFRGDAAGVPSPDEVARTAALVDHAALEVDPAGGRARLNAPGMAVDLGGIAKGWALDRAAAAARTAGAVGGVLDLGGNLVVFGEGPARTVGVVDPEDPSRLACTVPVAAGAVATSGQYERTASAGGQTWGHILDPRTGRPAPAGVAVTVVAADALVADALATAAVVLGAEAGLALLEDWPLVEGVVVTPDGIRSTSGLDAGD